MPSLDFKGKQYVYAHHYSVPFRQLNIDAKKSIPAKGQKPSLDDNLIIHGDNLHALKALLPKYAGKVKCIYIDPPYNTGEEGWNYNDNVNAPLIKEWLKDSANPVDNEDLERHDKWLCMMWPRLQLLRELLADDGVIFTSIDNNEFHHLKIAMDEIFGEHNHLSDIVRQSVADYPKPVNLIKNVIKIANLDDDDIVLDSFAGSGTTAQAVLEINKEEDSNLKFVLIQLSEKISENKLAYTLGYREIVEITAERVRRVIKGVPDAKDEPLKEGLGGSFTFCELGEAFDIDKILTGESLPNYNALAHYVFYTATGQSLDKEMKSAENFLIGETDLFEVYLIYKDDLAYLRSNESALNQEKLDAIAAQKSNKQKIVFATAKYMGQSELAANKITFCQIPYAIHKIAGN